MFKLWFYLCHPPVNFHGWMGIWTQGLMRLSVLLLSIAHTGNNMKYFLIKITPTPLVIFFWCWRRLESGSKTLIYCQYNSGFSHYQKYTSPFFWEHSVTGQFGNVAIGHTAPQIVAILTGILGHSASSFFIIILFFPSNMVLNML